MITGSSSIIEAESEHVHNGGVPLIERLSFTGLEYAFEPTKAYGMSRGGGFRRQGGLIEIVTDTGVRGTIGAEFRRINDYGHKVITDLRLSQIKNSIGAEYRIPVGRKATDYLNFRPTYSQEDIADGTATTYGIGSSLSTPQTFWPRHVPMG